VSPSPPVEVEGTPPPRLLRVPPSNRGPRLLFLPTFPPPSVCKRDRQFPRHPFLANNSFSTAEPLLFSLLSFFSRRNGIKNPLFFLLVEEDKAGSLASSFFPPHTAPLTRWTHPPFSFSIPRHNEIRIFFFLVSKVRRYLKIESFFFVPVGRPP